MLGLAFGTERCVLAKLDVPSLQHFTVRNVIDSSFAEVLATLGPSFEGRFFLGLFLRS